MGRRGRSRVCGQSTILPINPSTHPRIPSSHHPINPSTHPINPLTHPVNPSISTHQPIHSSHHPLIPSTHPLIPSSHQRINPLPATVQRLPPQPGGLRAGRLNKKFFFDDFWLFVRSLSCIGSSGRLVGRISTKFRPNPRQPLPIRSKSVT